MTIMRRSRTMRVASGVALALVMSGAVSAAVGADEEPSDDGHLDHGVPVPAGEALEVPPEPFDPSRHEAIPNTRPEANLAEADQLAPSADEGTAPLPERPAFDDPDSDGAPTGDGDPGDFPGTGDIGFRIWEGEGIYAVNDAETDLAIPDPRTLARTAIAGKTVPTPSRS